MEMIGGILGEIPMTGKKLGDKQSERIVKMASKHWVTYLTIYLHICISSRCPFKYTHLFLYFNSVTLSRTGPCGECV